MSCSSCNSPLPPSDAFPTPDQLNELRELLRSSHIPSNASSLLASSESVLEQHDAAIAGMQAQMDAMLATRAKVQHFVNGYRALQSPARRLPPELLSQIFEHISEGTANQPVNALAAELLRISRVSVRWHSAILGTPKLWTNITVDGREKALLLPALRLSLERATTQPLTVRIQNLESHPWLCEALELLAQHAMRWQHFSLTLTNTPWHYRVTTALLGLEGQLDCHHELQLLNFQSGANLRMFETAPNLRRVTIEARGNATCPKLPWSQLTSFTYLGIPPPHGSDIHAVLPVMANLSHPDAAFTLRALGEARNLPNITSSISSFTLYFTSFTGMRTSHTEALGRLWDSLTFTHLHTLTVGPYDPIHGNPPFWPQPKFRSLSLRSSFHDTLRVLRIANVVIDDTELTSVLGPLEALEWLEISDQGDYHTVTNHLLRFLAHQTPDGGPLKVPQLKYLSCDSEFVFTPQLYIDFILTRVGSDAEPRVKPVFEAVLRHLPSASEEKRKEIEEGPLQDLVVQGRLRFSFEAWVHPASLI